jgi:hypothetical protein
VIWAAVLIPPWIRRRRDGRPAESIMTFHRKLWELERTSIYSDGAYAYSDATYSDGVDTAAEAHGDLDGVHGPVDPAGAGVAVRRLDRRVAPRAGARSGAASDPAASAAQRLASRTALRRRRRIFSGLLGGLLSSLVAAVLVRSAAAWAVHGVVSMLFVTYIWLLFQHHQRVVEQVAKVRYLAPIRAPRPAVVVLRSGTGH